MSMRWRPAGAKVALLAAALGVAVLAGCGSGSTSASTTPTSSPSAAGIAVRLAQLTGYLSEVRPIAAGVGATVSALPDAVKGLTTKPGPSWNTAADKLDTAAKQLGAEASGLAELTPPTGLESVQNAAVQALRKAQSSVSKAADRLNKRQATSSADKAKIKAEIEQLKGSLSSVGRGLLSAIQGAIASPEATPSP